MDQFQGARVLCVMPAIGFGEERGDLAHDFVGIMLEGFVPVLFGERGEGEWGANVNAEVEFLKVFETIAHQIVFGAVHGGGKDWDPSPRGQVRGPRFAREQRFCRGAGPFWGDDQERSLFEFGIHVFEQADVRVFAVNPQNAELIANPSFQRGAFVFVGNDDDQIVPLRDVIKECHVERPQMVGDDDKIAFFVRVRLAC